MLGFYKYKITTHVICNNSWWFNQRMETSQTNQILGLGGKLDKSKFKLLTKRIGCVGVASRVMLYKPTYI
jgi:hypothetical protein